MALTTMANGKEIKCMALESTFPVRGTGMKAISVTDWGTVQELCSTLMVMFTKASGDMISNGEKEFSSSKTGIDSKEISQMDSLMVRV